MRQMIARGKAQLERAAVMVAGLNPSRPWRIEIARHQERRTLNQNKRYWCAVTELARETGHSKDEMHEAMKKMFLPPASVELGDHVVEITASSSKLGKETFAEFMEQVIAFAASEFGIVA